MIQINFGFNCPGGFRENCLNKFRTTEADENGAIISIPHILRYYLFYFQVY